MFGVPKIDISDCSFQIRPEPTSRTAYLKTPNGSLLTYCTDVWITVNFRQGPGEVLCEVLLQIRNESGAIRQNQQYIDPHAMPYVILSNHSLIHLQDRDFLQKCLIYPYARSTHKEIEIENMLQHIEAQSDQTGDANRMTVQELKEHLTEMHPTKVSYSIPLTLPLNRDESILVNFVDLMKLIVNMCSEVFQDPEMTDQIDQAFSLMATTDRDEFRRNRDKYDQLLDKNEIRIKPITDEHISIMRQHLHF